MLGVSVGPFVRRAGAAAAFDPASLFAASEDGAWFDPSDLSTLWQDSARTTPVTTDGDPVGAMDDKSGNGNHALQATAAKRPVYKTAGGLHWLEFDGVDDCLDMASGFATPAPTADLAVMGIRHTGGGSSQNHVWTYTNGLIFWRYGTTFQTYDGAAYFGTDTLSLSTDYVLSRRAAVSSTIYLSVNGGTAVTSTATAGLYGTGDGSLGANYGGAAGFLTGRIYGGIFRKAASTAQEETDAVNWMKAKAGL